MRPLPPLRPAWRTFLAPHRLRHVPARAAVVGARLSRSRLPRSRIVAALVVAVAPPLVTTARVLGPRDDRFTEHLGRGMLASLPPRAVLFTRGDLDPRGAAPGLLDQAARELVLADSIALDDYFRAWPAWSFEAVGHVQLARFATRALLLLSRPDAATLGTRAARARTLRLRWNRGSERVPRDRRSLGVRDVNVRVSP